ncbi:MAG TPA: acyl-CoA dehydrogenase family protein [Candidatus Binataceae bacterium]|nr:acyl-CoA dehydrogenase family protein [Candidatus Binataceae bacterium]
MSYMTDERKMIQQTARDFTMNEVLPVANKLDPVEGEIPMDLRDKMGELGYFGILIPEEYGGLGLGAFEYALVAEELARGWMSVASIIARGNGVYGDISEEQRRKYLPRMARGEFLGAFSLSEPDAGSDLANVSCRAVREGDEYVVNGTKTWCTFADGADFIHLFARTSPPEEKRRHVGITQFMIEKERGKLPEGCAGSPIRKIGYFGWKTWELHFENCRVPASAIIGKEGRGFYTMMAFLEVARVHTAARAIGLARGALEDSITYAGRRVQFKRPIGDFQAIRFKLAEMAANIEAARQLMYFVADEVDKKRRCDKEASMVKWFATEMAERVTSDALQIHGGYGYTKDLAIERYWRDARLTKIFEGTSQIQLRIISDRLLGGSGE